MTAEVFTAESRLEVIDRLGPALIKDADLAMVLDRRILDLGKSIGLLQEMAAKLGANTGFSKLVKSFKADGLVAGFEAASVGADAFTETVRAMNLATEKFAADGARMMNPLTDAVEKAQRQLGEFDRLLSRTPEAARYEHAIGGRARRGGRPERQSMTDRIGGTIMDAQMGIMTAEMVAKPELTAIEMAAQVQAQLLGIKNATGASDKEMASLRKAAEAAAAPTQFSALDEVKIAKLIATGTGLNAQQVEKLLPVFSNYADVQLLMKGTGYEKSTEDRNRGKTGGVVDLAVYRAATNSVRGRILPPGMARRSPR
ncbi:MAG: hypothetical protein WDN69_05040 [Aliidongia sp.]